MSTRATSHSWEGRKLPNDALNTFLFITIIIERKKFYLMMHSTHFYL